VANLLNYHLSDVLIFPHTPQVGYAYGQSFGYENVMASRLGKATGFDWEAFTSGGGGPATGGALSGIGQIFPQGQYAVFYDMPITITEIDFGPTPTLSATFLITDAAVTSTKNIHPFQAGIAATGRQLDEVDMDKLLLVASAGTGNLTLYAEGADGPVSGKYKIGYQLGT
jgi:hypothetical protein